MEVINVVTGQPVGFADIEQFLPRNSAPTSFFGFAWDGTTMKRAGGRLKTVPNGSYRIELTVLKALGDPANPAHIEHGCRRRSSSAGPSFGRKPTSWMKRLSILDADVREGWGGKSGQAPAGA